MRNYPLNNAYEKKKKCLNTFQIYISICAHFYAGLIANRFNDDWMSDDTKTHKIQVDSE